MKAKTDSTEYLNAQYAYEVDFHQKILAETDPQKRQQLSREAYAYAYAQSEAFSPEEVDFGFQEPELIILAPLLSGKHVVDYGCGYGSSTLALAQYARQVVGCDILPAVVDQAVSRLPTLGEDAHKVSFQVVDPGAFPFEPQSTDAVYASDVIEHLHPEDAQTFARAVYGALRPGGVFICITPHACYGPSDISARFLERGAASTGFHLKEYTYGTLQSLLHTAGFQSLSTPWLSPRHLIRLPGYGAFWRLFWSTPAFRRYCEDSPLVMASHGLRKVFGLNRSIYLVGRK